MNANDIYKIIFCVQAIDLQSSYFSKSKHSKNKMAYIMEIAENLEMAERYI